MTEAIQFIVNRQDDSLLTDSRKFKSYLLDLCSDNPRELKIINRALDDMILQRIFGEDRDNVKIAKLRDKFEEQGLSDTWSEFIISSFAQVLNWNYEPKTSQNSITNTNTTNNTSNVPVQTFTFTDDYINVSLNKTVLHRLYKLDIIDTDDETELTEIDIPDTYTYRDKDYRITSISENCFEDCTSLYSVTIPDTVKIIKEHAFSGCTSLETVEIPDGVKKIKGYAFFGCSALETIEIPDSVKTIGEHAFEDCDSLTEVIIADGVKTIGEYAFSNCESLVDIEIPDGVETIGECAFADCYSLTSMEIPDSVIDIGDDAFRGIETIYYDGTAIGEPWGANSVETSDYDDDDYDYDDDDDDDDDDEDWD